MPSGVFAKLTAFPFGLSEAGNLVRDESAGHVLFEPALTAKLRVCSPDFAQQTRFVFCGVHDVERYDERPLHVGGESAVPVGGAGDERRLATRAPLQVTSREDLSRRSAMCAAERQRFSALAQAGGVIDAAFVAEFFKELVALC